MKRYDLRGHKENFIPRMVELMNSEISEGENGIFLFEIGDFSSVQAAADTVKENNWRLEQEKIPLNFVYERFKEF